MKYHEAKRFEACNCGSMRVKCKWSCEDIFYSCEDCGKSVFEHELDFVLVDEE